MERTAELYGMPTCPVLGSYGGGDAMMLARQLVVEARPVSLLPPSLRQRILAAVAPALRAHALIPPANRVAHLPPPSAADGLVDDAVEWSASVQISGQMYGYTDFNVFTHGLLFQDVVKDPLRRGAVKYPLVGWFGSRGILPLLDDSEPAAVGMNALKWAEQHIHKADVDEYWHFGADMAKFTVDLEHPCALGWAAMVDLAPLPAAPAAAPAFVAPAGSGEADADALASEFGLQSASRRARIHVGLIVIVRGDLEEAIDSAAAIADGHASTMRQLEPYLGGGGDGGDGNADHQWCEFVRRMLVA